MRARWLAPVLIGAWVGAQAQTSVMSTPVQHTAWGSPGDEALAAHWGSLCLAGWEASIVSHSLTTIRPRDYHCQAIAGSRPKRQAAGFAWDFGMGQKTGRHAKSPEPVSRA